ARDAVQLPYNILCIGHLAASRLLHVRQYPVHAPRQMTRSATVGDLGDVGESHSRRSHKGSAVRVQRRPVHRLIACAAKPLRHTNTPKAIAIFPRSARTGGAETAAIT